MFSVNSTKASRNAEQGTVIPQVTAASTAPPRNGEEESVFTVVTHHAQCTPPRLALRLEDLPGSPPEPGTPNAGPVDPSGTPWTNRNLGRAPLQHSRPIYFSRRIYPAQANSYIGVLIPPASSGTQSTEIERLNALPDRIIRQASVIAAEHGETRPGHLASDEVQFEPLNLLLGPEVQSLYEPTI